MNNGKSARLQGGGDADFYYFRHWHAIDLFIYFAHSLVAIPPVGWVNAGHRHGVPVREPPSNAPPSAWVFILFTFPKILGPSLLPHTCSALLGLLSDTPPIPRCFPLCHAMLLALRTP